MQRLGAVVAHADGDAPRIKELADVVRVDTGNGDEDVSIRSDASATHVLDLTTSNGNVTLSEG